LTNTLHFSSSASSLSKDFASETPLMPVFDEQESVFTGSMEKSYWNTFRADGVMIRPSVNCSRLPEIRLEVNRPWHLHEALTGPDGAITVVSSNYNIVRHTQFMHGVLYQS